MAGRLLSVACLLLICGASGCSGLLHTDDASEAARKSQPTTAAAGSGGSELEIWNDPTFKKQFIGSYGINSEIEPRVTAEDVEILEKVRPLMADDLPKA